MHEAGGSEQHRVDPQGCCAVPPVPWFTTKWFLFPRCWGGLSALFQNCLSWTELPVCASSCPLHQAVNMHWLVDTEYECTAPQVNSGHLCKGPHQHGWPSPGDSRAAQLPSCPMLPPLPPQMPISTEFSNEFLSWWSLSQSLLPREPSLCRMQLRNTERAKETQPRELKTMGGVGGADGW